MPRKQTKGELFNQVVAPDEQARFGAGETLVDDGPTPSVLEFDSRVSDFHDRDIDGDVFHAIATYAHSGHFLAVGSLPFR